jgi:hypothetical protein
VPQITSSSWQDGEVPGPASTPSPGPAWDAESGTSSDEREQGWGERDWDRSESEEDPDEKRLREDRPPHHEERER